ncbi:hypothetical protein [Nocardia goodfellowii]|uniref:GNAT family N-acetyltransferase n=1 Tax=Nocardia goodfellowii TaxID=882446 RepID=A0ABS4QFX3_9NOCA|nr:hypothetical protein [Nocardia goodfellowii]MBP2190483.1 hypothetical protein [Nocardia goodfellowii]
MSEPNHGCEIRRCLLKPEGLRQKHAWVAVDDQNNALSVFVAIQAGKLAMVDCALYTTPSRRGLKLARDLVSQARRDLAAEDPSMALRWSGKATPDGYRIAASFGFSIGDEESAELGARLDKKLATKPNDDNLLAFAALRAQYDGRLPCDPVRQERADHDGREALREAAHVLGAQVIEEG